MDDRLAKMSDVLKDAELDLLRSKNDKIASGERDPDDWEEVEYDDDEDEDDDDEYDED